MTASANITFKSDALAPELLRADPRVVRVLVAAALRLSERGRSCVVTCVFRDQATQDRYRAEAQKLGRALPAISPHQFGRAIDIRTAGIPSVICREVCAQINAAFPYRLGDARYQTAIFHDAGQGEHIHLQVAPEGA